MATITIDVDDELARHIEDSARREQQSMSEWVTQRVKPDVDRAAFLEALELQARANGYPPGWLTLYGSLADDERFVAPLRNDSRAKTSVDQE